MSKLLVPLLFLLSCSAVPRAQQSPRTNSSDPIARAQGAFNKLVESETDWRAANAAKDELAKLGEAALDLIEDAAADHENDRVREACFDLLTSTFAKEDRSMEIAANEGLSDPASRIQYMCAFRLGEHKFYPAHRRLRIVLDNPASEEFTKYAAAKSLAELGEADVLRTLFTAIESDWYMHRYMGNLGLKGLTGKDLNDFESYDYSEGAFVSGGQEAVGPFDAIEQSQKRAKRYSAMTAYFKWLKSDKPELYKHLEPST